MNGEQVSYGLLLVYPGVATLPGQPATAFPTGFTGQVCQSACGRIGPYLEDRTPIRFAQLLAEEVGGYRRPPGYDVDELTN